jgi:hypothetical protein
MTGELKIKKTTTITKDMDYYLKEDGYQKHSYYDMYVKEIDQYMGSDFTSVSICFDFNGKFISMESEGLIRDNWNEYVMLIYSFEYNSYVISYEKQYEDNRKNRMYFYQPDVSSKIELTHGDFEGDFYVKTDEEKYILFAEFHDVFEEQLDSLNLTTDDLMEWSATLD